MIQKFNNAISNRDNNEKKKVHILPFCAMFAAGHPALLLQLGRFRPA
jgi:hypothetical protein